MLSLTDRNKLLKAKVNVGSVQFGQFEATIFKSDGSAAYPATGDWLIGSFARNAALQIPVIALSVIARADRATDE